MSRFLIFLSFIGLALSCTKDDRTLVFSEGITGKWRLFSSTSAWGNSTITGDALPWQEFYVFDSDSTFVKTRDQDGRLNEVTGSYFKDSQRSDGLYFVLEYLEDDDIISSCSKNREFLELKYGQLSNSSWAPCDGPILGYLPSE